MVLIEGELDGLAVFFEGVVKAPGLLFGEEMGDDMFVDGR